MRNWKEEAVPTVDIYINEVRRSHQYHPDSTFVAGGTHISCLLRKLDELQARNEALERECRELAAGRAAP